MTASRHSLTIDGAASERWEVTFAEIHERLFRPTRARVRAQTQEPVDLDALVGKDVSLELFVESQEGRAFHGVVLEVDETALDEDAFEVELTFGSKLTLLELGRDHRIFQEMSVPDIARDVLAGQA